MTREMLEDAIWLASFPQTYRLGQKQGSYTIPDKDMMVRALQSGLMLVGERNNAILRLDMAIACLWPQVRHLFLSNTFPHRLAAATSVLRHMNFGEGQPEETRNLAVELSQALDALEQILQKLDTAARAAEAARQASEPAPEDEEK